jgi:hypothetical protein
MMRSTVILWSGVPVTRFRALSVTQLLANEIQFLPAGAC